MDENPKIVSLGPGALYATAGMIANRGKPFGRVVRVFDEVFETVEDRFSDMGTVELHDDEAAGADNGAGAERQFAYCKDGDPLVIAFAPKAEGLSDSQLQGLMRHEFGHALEYRYGVAALEEEFGKKLPAEVERRADAIAEALWGEPVKYGAKNIQCVGRGKSPRPSHLPDEKAKLKPNHRGRWYFEDVDSFIDMLDESEPDYTNVGPFHEESAYSGRRVGWAQGHSVVEVPVEHVVFMEGNIWNFDHAAALKALIESGEYPTFELPAARLYRIDQSLVDDTQRYSEEGELSYQYSMEQPWDEEDAGTFYVQLVDGNHRALAAMAAGEPTIFVTVGPNYRDDVRDEEWVA